MEDIDAAAAEEKPDENSNPAFMELANKCGAILDERYSPKFTNALKLLKTLESKLSAPKEEFSNVAIEIREAIRGIEFDDGIQKELSPLISRCDQETIEPISYTINYLLASDYESVNIILWNVISAMVNTDRTEEGCRKLLISIAHEALEELKESIASLKNISYLKLTPSGLLDLRPSSGFQYKTDDEMLVESCPVLGNPFELWTDKDTGFSVFHIPHHHNHEYGFLSLLRLKFNIRFDEYCLDYHDDANSALSPDGRTPNFTHPDINTENDIRQISEELSASGWRNSLFSDGTLIRTLLLTNEPHPSSYFRLLKYDLKKAVNNHRLPPYNMNVVDDPKHNTIINMAEGDNIKRILVIENDFVLECNPFNVEETIRNKVEELYESGLRFDGILLVTTNALEHWMSDSNWPNTPSELYPERKKVNKIWFRELARVYGKDERSQDLVRLVKPSAVSKSASKLEIPETKTMLGLFFQTLGSDLDFQGRAMITYATRRLKKFITANILRESHIMRLNKLLSKTGIGIYPEIHEGKIGCTGKTYKYVTLSFKKINKTINVLFFEDHANLTSPEIEELGIKDEEKHYLDCQGLEGVWFTEVSDRYFIGEFETLDDARRALLSSERLMIYADVRKEPSVMDLKKLVKSDIYELGLARKKDGTWLLIKGTELAFSWPVSGLINKIHTHPTRFLRQRKGKVKCQWWPSPGEENRAETTEYVISVKGLCAYGGNLKKPVLTTWKELSPVNLPIGKLHTYFEKKASLLPATRQAEELAGSAAAQTITPEFTKVRSVFGERVVTHPLDLDYDFQQFVEAFRRKQFADVAIEKPYHLNWDPTPIMAILSLTCDNNCRHCMFSCNSEDVREMSTEDFNRVANLDGIDVKSHSIHLTGGEISLRKDLFEIISRHDINMINTNASRMVSKNKAKTFVSRIQQIRADKGRFVFRLSLDDSHLAGKAVSLEKIANLVEAIVLYYPTANIVFNCLESTFSAAIDDFIEEMSKRGMSFQLQNSGSLMDENEYLVYIPEEGKEKRFLVRKIPPGRIGRALHEYPDSEFKQVDISVLPKNFFQYGNVVDYRGDASFSDFTLVGHSPLVFGNVLTDSWKDIIVKLEKDPLFRAMVKNPKSVLKYADEYDEGIVQRINQGRPGLLMVLFYWVFSSPERKLYVTYRLFNDYHDQDVLTGANPFKDMSNDEIKKLVQKQVADLRQEFQGGAHRRLIEYIGFDGKNTELKGPSGARSPIDPAKPEVLYDHQEIVRNYIPRLIGLKDIDKRITDLTDLATQRLPYLERSNVLSIITHAMYNAVGHGKIDNVSKIRIQALADANKFIIRISNQSKKALPAEIANRSLYPDSNAPKILTSERDLYGGVSGLGINGITKSLKAIYTDDESLVTKEPPMVRWNQVQSDKKRPWDITFELHIPRRINGIGQETPPDLAAQQQEGFVDPAFVSKNPQVLKKALAEKYENNGIKYLLRYFSRTSKIKIKFDKNIKEYTTLRINSNALAFTEPASVKELRDILIFAHKNNIPVNILGRGSNTLFGEHVPALVISMNKFSSIKVKDNLVRVGAGIGLRDLANKLKERGLSGLEFTSVIPGTAGGAVVMNAGFRADSIDLELKESKINNVNFTTEKVVEEVKVITLSGELKTLTKDEIKFGIKHSIFQSEPMVIYEVTFRLKKRAKKNISRIMEIIDNGRLLEAEMWTSSLGAVFRPQDESYVFEGKARTANWFIEQLGAKGWTEGGMAIHDRDHIVLYSKGNATQEDYIALAARIYHAVYEKFGVKLVVEVKSFPAGMLERQIQIMTQQKRNGASRRPKPRTPGYITNTAYTGMERDFPMNTTATHQMLTDAAVGGSRIGKLFHHDDLPPKPFDVAAEGGLAQSKLGKEERITLLHNLRDMKDMSVVVDAIRALAPLADSDMDVRAALISAYEVSNVGVAVVNALCHLAESDENVRKIIPGNWATKDSSASKEAVRIHAENLKPEYMPIIPDKTVLIHIVDDSILPFKQRDTLNRLAIETKKAKYPEKIIQLSLEDPDNSNEFIKKIEEAKDQGWIKEYQNKGYTVLFDVACHSKKLVGIVQDKLDMQALAFIKESEGDIIQVEGIILALRVLRNGKIDDLLKVYKLLTGKELTTDIKDIKELAKTMLFELPVTKLDAGEINRINTLIEENIRQAA